METAGNTSVITVKTTIEAPVEKVWQLWTDPEHVVNWNYATSGWHTPSAVNDLREGGSFRYRMEEITGTTGFNFEGTYTELIPYERIGYQMPDGRKVTLEFISENDITSIVESFIPEPSHSLEMQKVGWQAILDNFKRYVESFSETERMHFETYIESPPEEVYRLMLDRETWSQWASAFDPGSFYEGSWESGAEIRFMATGRDGTRSGLISRITENIPGQYISIDHVGLILEGQEITSGNEVDKLTGNLEYYSFLKQDEGTLLSVDIEVNNEFSPYLVDSWPKALEKLKELCENRK